MQKRDESGCHYKGNMGDGTQEPKNSETYVSLNALPQCFTHSLGLKRLGVVLGMCSVVSTAPGTLGAILTILQ